MEADDALEVGSAAGEFEDGCAAEAIAGRGEFGPVGAGVLLEDIERRGEAGPEEGAVLLVFPSFLSGRRWLWAHALTIDICDEHIVAEFSQLAGSFLFVSADTRPLVDDEDRRALALEVIVVGVPAFADDVPGLILDGFFDDGGTERTEEGDSGEGGAVETGQHGST